MTRKEARLTLQEIFGLLSFEYPGRISEAIKIAIEVLSHPSLPSSLDEAAEKIVIQLHPCMEYSSVLGDHLTMGELVELVKSGAEWMAGQGWIDDGSMPPETKQESDTLQGHREWTESEPVLAWDSLYGCRVDWTRNGKWMSEQTGGYTGQVCHGIIAWRPIPKYKEKQ